MRSGCCLPHAWHNPPASRTKTRERKFRLEEETARRYQRGELRQRYALLSSNSSDASAPPRCPSFRPQLRLVPNTVTNSQPSSPSRFNRSLNFCPSNFAAKIQIDVSNMTVVYSHFIDACPGVTTEGCGGVAIRPTAVNRVFKKVEVAGLRPEGILQRC